MRREFRKPLVIMTPKSLLRHQLAVSSARRFIGESHFRRILSRPQAACRRQDPAAGAVLGQGRLRPDRGARRGRRPRGRRDRPHRAALSVPARAAGRRLKAMPSLEELDLGAGRAEEQRRLARSSRSCIEKCLRRRGLRRHAPAICRAATPARRRPPGSPSATRPSRRRLIAARARSIRQSGAGKRTRRQSRRNKGKSWPPTSKSPRSGNRSPKARSPNGSRSPAKRSPRDEPIASLETDKVTVEVPSPVAGVLTEQLVKDGDTVAVGAVIARIDEGRPAAAATRRQAAAERDHQSGGAERDARRCAATHRAAVAERRARRRRSRHDLVAGGAPRGARISRRPDAIRAPARTGG